MGSFTGQNKVPHTQFIQYFTPGTYTFVGTLDFIIRIDNKVTGSNATAQGLFAVHVDAAPTNIQTNDGGNFWRAPIANDGVTCTSSTYRVPYISYSWTQATTGRFDFLFFAYNATATRTWGFTANIYNGYPSFLGTGTSASPAIGCVGMRNFKEIY